MSLRKLLLHLVQVHVLHLHARMHTCMHDHTLHGACLRAYLSSAGEQAHGAWSPSLIYAGASLTAD